MRAARHLDVNCHLQEVFEIQFGDDPIFRSDIKSYPENTRRINDSKYYGYPDRTLHIFSNCMGEFYAIDNFNIPIPIRNNEDMPAWAIESQHKNHDADGIYIIDRTIINQSLSISDMNVFMKYLGYRTGISETYKRKIREDIHQCTNTNPVVIRHIVFIPKAVIDEYGAVYDRQHDIVLSSGSLDYQIVHPRSTVMEDMDRSNEVKMLDGANIITIKIIDNDNPFKEYFIPIGNSVHRVISEQSRSKPDGLELIVKKDDTVVTNVRELDKSKYSEHGIYPSKDEALYGSDIDKLMKDKQIDLADKKMILEHMKIANANQKIVYDHEVHKIKMDEGRMKMYKSFIDNNSENTARVVNMFTDMSDRNHSIRMEKIKSRNEAAKSRQADFTLLTSIAKIV